MSFFRTIIFYIFFISLTIILGGSGLLLVNFRKEFAVKISKMWCRSTLYLLKIICGVKCKIIKDYELPESYIAASKHQSAYETFLFWQLIKNPAYILKKELLNIPIFGSYLKHTGMISIDRKAGHQSMVKILKFGKESYQQNRNLIIFPEGTRTKYGKETMKYSSGVYGLYQTFDKPIVPIALNTGKFWSNFRFTIKPGTIIVKFLPVIPTGLEKEEFLKTLRDTIEIESAKL